MVPKPLRLRGAVFAVVVLTIVHVAAGPIAAAETTADRTLEEEIAAETAAMAARLKAAAELLDQKKYDEADRAIGEMAFETPAMRNAQNRLEEAILAGAGLRSPEVEKRRTALVVAKTEELRAAAEKVLNGNDPEEIRKVNIQLGIWDSLGPKECHGFEKTKETLTKLKAAAERAQYLRQRDFTKGLAGKAREAKEYRLAEMFALSLEDLAKRAQHEEDAKSAKELQEQMRQAGNEMPTKLEAAAGQAQYVRQRDFYKGMLGTAREAKDYRLVSMIALLLEDTARTARNEEDANAARELYKQVGNDIEKEKPYWVSVQEEIQRGNFEKALEIGDLDSAFLALDMMRSDKDLVAHDLEEADKILGRMAVQLQEKEDAVCFAPVRKAMDLQAYKAARRVLEYLRGRFKIFKNKAAQEKAEALLGELKKKEEAAGAALKVLTDRLDQATYPARIEARRKEGDLDEALRLLDVLIKADEALGDKAGADAARKQVVEIKEILKDPPEQVKAKRVEKIRRYLTRKVSLEFKATTATEVFGFFQSLISGRFALEMDPLIDEALGRDEPAITLTFRDTALEDGLALVCGKIGAKLELRHTGVYIAALPETAAKVNAAREAEAKDPALVKTRIDANEAAAWATIRTLAAAQTSYHQTDWEKDGTLEYARSIKDLFMDSKWVKIGLVPERLVYSEGNPSAKPKPKEGYCFKTLKAAARDGKVEPFADQGGKVTRGFAFLAWPAQYGRSGTRCFMVSGDGVVYQRDLGTDTHALVETMDAYDPSFQGKWEVCQ